MKRRLLLVLVFLAGVLLVSCTNERLPIYDDTTQPIVVVADDEFVIAINYEPTTEYFWSEQYDSAALELLESTCVLCTEGELERVTPFLTYSASYQPSADAVNFSRFKALKAGETEVTMVFKRPLEETHIEQKIFKVIVK